MVRAKPWPEQLRLQEGLRQTSVAKEVHVTELLRREQWPTRAGSQSWIWLAVAAVLLLFTYGRWNVPLAAWLAPVFLLRFVRTQSLKVGLPVAYLLMTAANAFQLRGMVPILGAMYYIFLALFAIPAVFPYVIARVLAHRLAGL